MIRFKISPYGSKQFLLTKIDDEREDGLRFSSTIFMHDEDIDELIRTLKEYGNERGNKRFQSVD